MYKSIFMLLQICRAVTSKHMASKAEISDNYSFDCPDSKNVINWNSKKCTNMWGSCRSGHLLYFFLDY